MEVEILKTRDKGAWGCVEDKRIVIDQTRRLTVINCSVRGSIIPRVLTLNGPRFRDCSLELEAVL